MGELTVRWYLRATLRHLVPHEAPSAPPAGPARALPAEDAAGGVREERLDGGLRVLLREEHAAPVAEVQIWAGVGSADERPGEEGLAHFHEHMLFKGTERRGVGEVAGEIEGAGGRINAYTSFDVTVYHATVPAGSWPTALDVLADSVQHSIFDPAEVEREIEVVLEEIRRSEDSPASVLGNALFRTAYREHPYSAPILGSRESVSSFTPDRVRAFFRRWYRADNLTLVAVGDFDSDRVLAAARQAFAGARPGAPPRSRPREPARRKPAAVVLRRHFERTSVELAWPGLRLADDDAPLLDLLAFILGEGDSSRLVRRVKEGEGLCDRIDAWSYTPLDPGLVGVSFETDPERLERALAAAVREAMRLRWAPVSQAELDKARANFLASEHFERESVSGLARKVGSFELLAGDHRRDARYLETIRRATPGDLLRVARAHLRPEALVAAVLLPEGAEARLDEGRVLAAAGEGEERCRRAFTAPVPRGRTGRGPGEIHSFRLSCGSELHVAPRRGLPVVGLRAAFLGGQLAETEETAGISAFLSQMWLRGTRSRSAADLARAIEGLAVDIDGFSGRSSLGLTLDATSDRLPAALDLLAEILLEPAFDAEELERERRDTLAALRRREDHLGARVFELFAEAHYRRHPYRLPLGGTPKSVEAFTPEAVAQHHTRLVRAGNLVLGVAGDVDPEAVAEALSLRLADLDASPAERPIPPEEEPPREVRERELRKDREQAHLVIGFRGLRVDDPDRFALEVISQILAGQGGRLFLTLRDRQSLAYAVSCVNVEGVAPGFLAVYIATAPDKLGRARTGILDQIRRLLDEPPSEAELDRARRHLTGAFAIEQQRAAARAAHLSLDALYGLGPEASWLYPEAVEAVGRDDVLRVARRVFDLDAYTAAVIRP